LLIAPLGSTSLAFYHQVEKRFLDKTTDTVDILALEQAVRAQLLRWFGEEVSEWEFLRAYHVPFAQPSQEPPYDPSPAVRALDRGPKELVEGMVYCCGDHCGTPSLNGALASGRAVALHLLSGHPLAPR
jgi:predicted NAD/FAD-dependent oxidoreductase